MTYPFDLQQGVILVVAELQGPCGSAVLRLALDTGATTTLINVGMLTFAGYDPALSATRLEITTGSGVEQVPEVVVSRLKALGEACVDLPVLAHTLPTSADVDGLLGLDFFNGRILTIDFRTSQITLV